MIISEWRPLYFAFIDRRPTNRLNANSTNQVMTNKSKKNGFWGLYPKEELNNGKFARLKRGPLNWPANSPDLAPFAFFLCH